ncbi:MAG: mechanosensitive ion channel domain-containing protein [Pseudomonadota bacterium]
MNEFEKLAQIDLAIVWTRLVTITTTYGLNIIAAIIIFILGRWAAGLIARATDKMLMRAQVDRAIISFVHNLVYVGVLIFVVIAALSKLGIQTASFVAVLGAAGLAIGLALQGSLSNFAAGVLLIIFRPFKEGDYIEAGGTAGIVERIMIFSTQLRSPDNKRIIVPNSSVTGSNIINYSANATRRIDLMIGIDYAADLKKAKYVLQQLVDAETRILKNEEIFIGVAALADSSVNFVIRFWVMSTDYWPVTYDLNEKIKIALDDAGIAIPFPQMNIHFDPSSLSQKVL